MADVIPGVIPVCVIPAGIPVVGGGLEPVLTTGQKALFCLAAAVTILAAANEKRPAALAADPGVPWWWRWLE